MTRALTRHAVALAFAVLTTWSAGCGDDAGTGNDAATDGDAGTDADAGPDRDAGPAVDAGTDVEAASCSLEDVRAAIAAASAGEIVGVPAGECTWNESLDFSKGVHLRGAGSASLTVHLGAPVTMNKSRAHSLELSGFAFDEAGAGTMFFVWGEWDAEPPLIHDNAFSVDGGIVFSYGTNGGVIYNNTFEGTWDDGGIQHKLAEDPANAQWPVPDSMGTHDTTGKMNLYVEDNVFIGMSNQNTDFDDGARVVFRYNTLTNACFNSHGLATSPVGVRHYEIYNNTFSYPDDTVNQNWFIWLRGGTGVIYDNDFDDIVGTMWGDKPELHLSVRAIHDNQCCTTYPCDRQIGQSTDTSGPFTDPLYLWSNRGTLALDLSTWADSCGNGQEIGDYLQEGRDYVFATEPKPGYTPYPYPHPLR